MWIHEWPKTMRGNAWLVARQARAYGVTTIYLRTGTQKGGFDGSPQLRALLKATHGTGIQVVPWDFPTMENPQADARRLALAASYRRGRSGTPLVRAVAPDIETGSEGTRLTTPRVRIYLRTLRTLLPKGTSILATVPWPSEQRRGRFPYGTIAAHSTALMPMTYWYNRSPGAVTTYSIRWLGQFHRPILPVGQGYDSTIDAPYLPHSNQAYEIVQFLRAARLAGVRAVSLWSWQTAGRVQWRALAAYRGAFHAPDERPRRPVHARPARPGVPRPTVVFPLRHRWLFD
jgi:hypothetical protein